MKKIAMIVGVGSCLFFGYAQAATINISTGIAGWGVARDQPSPTYVAATALSQVQANSLWAGAPAGSAWVSSSVTQGTSCVVGQTPGNGCATALVNINGDLWDYRLTISAAELGSTSGFVYFVFGADNRVDVYVGLGTTPQTWNSSSPLGCAASPAPTSAGSSQAIYNTCASEVLFNASNLNADGSLTILAQVHNDPIPSCSTCGDPTGFVLRGDVAISDEIFKNGFN
jgi:hypothetical protein